MAIEQNDYAEREMPRYKSHKTVWALKIKSVEKTRPTIAELEEILNQGKSPVGAILHFEEDGYGPLSVSQEYVQKHDPQAGGYYVVYEGGYASWSPAEAFESGYRAIPRFPDLPPSTTPIMRYFEFAHLPARLQEVSQPLAAVARIMDNDLPNGAEKSAGLRKLLEAKDCFVRAKLG